MGHFVIQTMGITTLKGDWSISHLRVLIAITCALQKNIKNRLNPASRPIPVTNKLNIPPRDFHMGPSNGMYLREVLQSSKDRGLISGYSYPCRASVIEVQLAKEMMEKMLDVSSGFTRYSLETAHAIKRKSTLRLYWLVCSWRSRGGFQLPADDLRYLLGLGPAYQRADNIVTHILEPAREELEALQETWFSYKMTARTISFKVHYNLTEEEKLQLSRDCWDQCFRLLSAAGLSFRLIADLFPRVRPEDQPAFVAKLQSILLDISQRRDLRNPAAYVHAALEGWLNSF